MEGWSSKSVSMDVLIVKVEETAKKLRSVGGKKANLVISGSLLAWFFSAYNQLEARTNELLSTLNKLSLPNRISILNGEFISSSSLSNNNSPYSIFKPGPNPDPEPRGKKTARSTCADSDNSSQQEPKTKRSRTDNSEEGSSSGGVRLDDLIVKVEELVKKLKGVDRRKGLVSGPLLASFMFAHTQLEDWTNQLLSTSTMNEPSHSSSSSPSKKSASNNSDPNFVAGPITPEARGKKTPRLTSPDNRSEEEPETKRARTEQNSGSSLTVPLDDLIVKMKEMVNMLKSEGRLVNGPLLGCFVSAQTLLMACATELLSISTEKSKALHHQGSEVSINYSSTTTNDTAADGNGEKK